MEQFLVSIEKSIEVENWMSAIFTSLCIPDICGAAENKIQGNGARYRDWFNRYINTRLITYTNCSCSTLLKN